MPIADKDDCGEVEIAFTHLGQRLVIGPLNHAQTVQYPSRNQPCQCPLWCTEGVSVGSVFDTFQFQDGLLGGLKFAPTVIGAMTLQPQGQQYQKNHSPRASPGAT